MFFHIFSVNSTVNFYSCAIIRSFWEIILMLPSSVLTVTSSLHTCAFLIILHSLLLSERSRLSPGPVLGGHPDDHLLFHGPAVVRGCHCHLHRPHWLSENGDPDVGPWGAAQISGCEVSMMHGAKVFLFSQSKLLTVPGSWFTNRWQIGRQSYF